MRIVGLIAEYNPFHNGHQFHIQQAKQLTQADAVIVVMSGNFVQRGTPAIMPKHLRAEAALSSGADLVLELPVYYATGTAETFAYGAISILNQLGCVDAICFGSECGDIEVLKEVSHILVKEPSPYKDGLQRYLRLGHSFPSARQEAICDMYPDKDYATILEQPNNILGIEYLKVLEQTNSKITPYTISRKASAYHDVELGELFSSATAIRAQLEKDSLSDIVLQVPDSCMEIMKTSYKKRFPIHPEDFSLLLKYRLLNETKTSLTSYVDVSTELANRIYNKRNQYVSFEQFCNLLKTKEITYSRISRALLHILLNIKKENHHAIEYARILGFRKDKTELLTTMKQSSSIPLVTRIADEQSEDIFASNLYESVITEKYKTSFINEYEHPIVRI